MGWGPASSPSKGGPQSIPAHRYKNKAASSMLLLRGQQAADVDVSELSDPRWHAAWAADPLLVGASPGKFGGCQMAATLLATDQVGIRRLEMVGGQGKEGNTAGERGAAIP